MGFVNSGNHFVSEIMHLLQDLDLIMEVADALIQAPNEEELLDKFEALLKRCRIHNIRLARWKLKFGLVVVFAGYQIGGNDSYRPDKKKIDALA